MRRVPSGERDSHGRDWMAVGCAGGVRAALARLGVLLALGCAAPATAAAGDACPNAAVRAQQGSGFLPDCRAYERVSPAEKAGGDVCITSTLFPFNASPAGDAAQFQSTRA